MSAMSAMTATAVSMRADSERAVQDVLQQVRAAFAGQMPSLVFVYGTASHDPEVIAACFAASGVLHIGGSSCSGLMTERGMHRERHVLGVLAVRDPKGQFGVGGHDKADSPRKATRIALERALTMCERPGEVPSLVWIHGAPGGEEQVLLGLHDVLGHSVPVVGGSSADDDISGAWYQLANGVSFRNGVVVAVLFPSGSVSTSMHSGYAPTEHRAVVTRAFNRTLHELDGEPAALVYNRWTGGGLGDDVSGGHVLMRTALAPLGHPVERIGSVELHMLAHPERVTREGALELFADVHVGQEVVLMKGTLESLVSRAGRVADRARQKGRCIGGLVTYCAGCMLAVDDRMPEVVDSVNSVLRAPFLGIFTFGEQGALLGPRAYHGNLMISVVSLGQPA
ncbi:MAG: hypothetical protein ACI9MC_002103 [Kiritimatiellia bacterium]|jgi:hypothetical protein